LKECLDAFIQDCWQAFADKSVHEQSSVADVNVIFCQFEKSDPICTALSDANQSYYLPAISIRTPASNLYLNVCKQVLSSVPLSIVNRVLKQCLLCCYLCIANRLTSEPWST
jgi:hypothetical protein